MSAVAQWTCQRCGSSERRPGGKGCAACNRRPPHPGLSRAEGYLFTRLLRDDFADITVTRPMSAYLEAFTAYLRAEKVGDLHARRRARAWRRRLLADFEAPATPPAEEVACP